MYDAFPEILALEESYQAPWRVFEPLDHVLTVFDPPFAQPAAHVLLEGAHARIVVEDDESLDLHPLAEHHRKQLRRAVDTLRELLQVVPGDQAAQRDPRVHVEQRHHRREHGSTHTLEIDVDALRAHRGETLWQVGVVMVEAFIEPESAARVLALLPPTRN